MSGLIAPRLRLALSGGVSAIAISMAVSAPAAADGWAPRGETGGVFYDSQSRSSNSVFVPLAQDSDSLLFGTALGDFSSDFQQGSFGGGMRWSPNDTWGVGFNATYDVMSAPSGNTYHQFSAGAELRAGMFEAYGNIYEPFTGEQLIGAGGGGGAGLAPNGCVIDSLCVDGNEIGIMTAQGARGGGGLFEAPRGGWDARLGLRIPLGAVGDNGLSGDLGIFGGYYNYDADGPYDDLSGGMGQVTLRLDDPFDIMPGSRIEVGAQWREDDFGDGRFSGMARISVPLQFGDMDGPTTVSPRDRFMTQAIDRRGFIPLGERGGAASGGTFTLQPVTFTGLVGDDDGDPGTSPTLVLNGTGEEIASIFWAVSGATGTGTADDPMGLADAMTNAGANGLVVVSGEGGTFTGNNTISWAGQILMGGESIIQVDGTDSDGQMLSLEFIPTDFRASATRPTVSGVGGGTEAFNITGLSDVYLTGFDITDIGTSFASQEFGVFVDGGDGHTLHDINVTGGTASFVLATDAGVLSNFRMLDIGIQDAAFGVFGNSSGSGVNGMVIEDVSITNASEAGFYFTDGNQANFAGLEIVGASVMSSQTGLIFQNIGGASQIQVTDFTADDVRVGVQFLTASNVLLTNTTVTNVTATINSVGVQGIGASNITFNGLTLTSTTTGGPDSAGALNGIRLQDGGAITITGLNTQDFSTGVNLVNVVGGSITDFNIVGDGDVNATTSGISISNGAAPADFVISNGMISNISGFGVRLSASHAGFSTTTITDVAIAMVGDPVPVGTASIGVSVSGNMNAEINSVSVDLAASTDNDAVGFRFGGGNMTTPLISGAGNTVANISMAQTACFVSMVGTFDATSSIIVNGNDCFP